MPLSLKFAIRGNLREQLAREFKVLERSVKKAVDQSGQELKGQLRQDTNRANLGAGVANAWRARTYPVNQASANSAAVVWSKAPRIILNFEFARPITAKRRKFLAIPTEAARQSGIGGKSFVRGARQSFTVGRAGNPVARSRVARLSPSTFPEGKLGKLRFIPTPKGGVLVADKVSPTFSRKTGTQSGFRRAGPKSRSPGKSVIMFVLVRQVRPRKRLNVVRLAVRQRGRMATRIADAYKGAPLLLEQAAR